MQDIEFILPIVEVMAIHNAAFVNGISIDGLFVHFGREAVTDAQSQSGNRLIHKGLLVDVPFGSHIPCGQPQRTRSFARSIGAFAVEHHIEDIFTRIAVGSIKRESNPPVVSLVQIEIIVTLAYQFAEYQWIGVDLISPVVLNAITLERIDRAHSRSYLGKGKSL